MADRVKYSVKLRACVRECVCAPMQSCFTLIIREVNSFYEVSLSFKIYKASHSAANTVGLKKNYNQVLIPPCVK